MAKDAKKVEPPMTDPKDKPTEDQTVVDQLADALEKELGGETPAQPPEPDLSPPPFRHTGGARTELPMAPSLPSIRLPVPHIFQDGTVNEVIITDGPNKLELTAGGQTVALVSNDQAVRLANALVIAARLKWVQKVV